MDEINIVKSTDVTATLLNLPLGKTFLCPNRVISSSVIRTVASRLKSQNRGLFLITAAEDGVLITRK